MWQKPISAFQQLWMSLLQKIQKCLWDELCDRKGYLRTTGGRRTTDAFAESYWNAQHWSTRRQILTILTDKLSFKEVQEFIPTVTSYRYNIARHHTLLHGRTEPIPNHEYRRMKVDQGKLEDFITFITSPHVLQVVPFGASRVITRYFILLYSSVWGLAEGIQENGTNIIQSKSCELLSFKSENILLDIFCYILFEN